MKNIEQRLWITVGIVFSIFIMCVLSSCGMTHSKLAGNQDRTITYKQHWEYRKQEAKRAEQEFNDAPTWIKNDSQYKN